MTENIKAIINVVSNNDITRAKKAAIVLLKSDTAKKDEYFCRQTLAKLENAPTTLQLPTNISNFATMEDVSQTFIRNRYFLTEREEKLYNEIVIADKAGKRLAEMKIRHLNATILYGESGTGKTTFGRFLAYQLGIPFLYLNFSGLISSLLGQTGNNIKRVFDYAKQQRCVFMLDEIDAIATERHKSVNDVSEMSRIVIALMQSLDLIENDVIILAATNRYDVIDKAVKRRFTKSHQVEKLRTDERLNFGSSYLKDCGYNLPEEEIFNIIGDKEKQSDIENNIVSYIIKNEAEKLEKETLS